MKIFLSYKKVWLLSTTIFVSFSLIISISKTIVFSYDFLILTLIFNDTWNILIVCFTLKRYTYLDNNIFSQICLSLFKAIKRLPKAIKIPI